MANTNMDENSPSSNIGPEVVHRTEDPSRSVAQAACEQQGYCHREEDCREAGRCLDSPSMDREALLLLPAVSYTHGYLLREDAPDDNKVQVVLGVLTDALLRWEDANPLPDDEDQMPEDDVRRALEKDCCRTLRYENGHASGCQQASVTVAAEVRGGLVQPWGLPPDPRRCPLCEHLHGTPSGSGCYVDGCVCYTPPPAENEPAPEVIHTESPCENEHERPVDE